jgi:hypothetical protein
MTPIFIRHLEALDFTRFLFGHLREARSTVWSAHAIRREIQMPLIASVITIPAPNNGASTLACQTPPNLAAASAKNAA